MTGRDAAWPRRAERTVVDGVDVLGSLSPSRASDFMTCPLLFRFRTIDRLPGAVLARRGPRHRRAQGARGPLRPARRPTGPGPGRRGGAAIGSRFLGSPAASRPARPVAPHRDPLSHRDRLSAVQLHRPRRQSGGLQRRSGAALCEEIKVTCTIQMRRFETLLDAIASNRGDAIIASMAVTPQMRARVDFTDPYYRAPARFVARARRGDGGGPPRISRRQEGRRDRRLDARGLSQGDVHRRRVHSFPNDDALRAGAAARRGRLHLRRRDLAGVLDQRHRFRRLLRLLAAGRSSRAAFSARASASPCAKATTCCARR